MTDMLQKNKNVAKNVANENSQDLTEQWKKGEFIICNAGKCQYYYVQNEEQKEVIKTEYCLFDDNTPNWQILAPVPSYDEWKQLKERNDSLNNRDINLCRIANGIRDENFALKELLKECREEINPYIEVIGGKKTFKNLIDKIDEVLK